MDKKVPTRQDAWELLNRYNKNENLIRHALAVESVMAHFAERLGEDREKWSAIGLAHDVDYELYPHEHCKKTREILEQENWPEEYIRAVESHGWKICTDVEPAERMEKVLYTIDELTGLVAATAMVRPGKSIMDMKAKSVQKKWKQAGFAAGVKREIIEEGARMMGMDLTEVIEETIKGMQKAAGQIGLAGE